MSRRLADCVRGGIAASWDCYCAVLHHEPTADDLYEFARLARSALRVLEAEALSDDDTVVEAVSDAS